MRLPSLVLLLSLAALPAAAAEPPSVVVSIKPVHGLVAGVMAGVATPWLLVGGAATPHSYQLRPSDARALEASRLVVRVGKTLDGFLEKPLAALAGGARVVELMAAEGVALLPAREGGAWAAHQGHAHGHGGSADRDGHGEIDGHLWLDPHNAAAIVRLAVAELATLDPERAARYRANGERMLARVEATEARLADRLAPVARVPYLVFHDAYQYLEAHFGLNAVGAIAVSPDRKPSARRLREIRKRLAATGARCVFSEPQFSPDIARTVVEGSEARLAVLDPLGADLAEGPDAWFQLLDRLADSLVGCLAPSG